MIGEALLKRAKRSNKGESSTDAAYNSGTDPSLKQKEKLERQIKELEDSFKQ